MEHVRTWQAAYAGLIPQDYLDSMEPAQREPAWRRRLDELSVGDLAVRGSFAVSYHNLPAPADQLDPRRCFRLLGLAGADVTIPAVCALVDDSVERVERAVETLVDANLVQYQGSDRYRLHDLLRVYAAERVGTDEPLQELTAALGRLHGWYLRTAAKARRAGEMFVNQVASALLLGIIAWCVGAFFISAETSRPIWIAIGICLALPKLIPAQSDDSSVS